MKLPSLKIAIPVIFLIWCIVGVKVHGTVMLAYPAMWAGVGLFFVALHFMLRAPAAPNTTAAEGESTELPTNSDSTNNFTAEKEMSASA